MRCDDQALNNDNIKEQKIFTAKNIETASIPLPSAGPILQSLPTTRALCPQGAPSLRYFIFLSVDGLRMHCKIVFFALRHDLALLQNNR